MAWLSRYDHIPTDNVKAEFFNFLALDDQNWGGDVNGGGYKLSNVILDGSGGFAYHPSPLEITPGGDGRTVTQYDAGTDVASYKPRWTTGKDATAESGANAGSDFAISRYSDAGTLLGTPFAIIRSTGVIQMGSQKWLGPIDGNGQILSNITIAGMLADPTTTKGDLIGRAAAGPATRLGVGADGQILMADAASTLGVKWAAAPATGVPTTRQVLAGVGMIGGGALSADVTLTAKVFVASGASHAIGAVPDPGATAGTTKYLREDATWVAPPGGFSDPTTTKGDLIGRATAGPATRLAVGSDGQVLTADAASTLGVKWAAASGGGHVIQDEGTPLTQRAALNFVGGGVVVTDDSGNNRSIVTISGGGGGTSNATVVATVTGGTAIANSITQASLFAGATTTGSLTIPAAAVIVGGVIDITIIGSMLMPAASMPTITVTILCGGTSIGTLAFTTTAALTSKSGKFTINAYILRNAATTSVLGGVIRLGQDNANASTIQGVLTAGTSFNLTNSCVLDVQAKFGTAVAGSSIANDMTEIVVRNPGTITGGGFLGDVTTTKGDLIVRGAAAPPTRLGVGTDGWVLTADSTQALGMKWAAGGSGSQTPWLSHISGGGFDLYNVANVSATNAVLAGSTGDQFIMLPNGLEYAAAGGAIRWFMNKNGAESGGNSGSDWALYRYSDAGAYIDYSILITRADGTINFKGTNLVLTTLGAGGNYYMNSGPVSAAWGSDGASNCWMGTFSNHPFVIYSNATARMTVTAAGNVGIGTTPAYKLDVAGDINISAGSVYRVNGVAIGAGGSQTPWTSNIDGGAFTLTNVGAIGIGRTSVGYYLDVIAGSASVMRLAGPGASATLVAAIDATHNDLQFQKDPTPTAAASIGMSSPASGLTSDIVFAAYAGAWAERMRLTNAGSLGIGTASPAGKFDVTGGTSYFRGNNNAFALSLRNGAATTDFLVGASSAGDCVFSDTNGTERMRITAAGKVGIATASATSYLTVLGTASDPTLTHASPAIATWTDGLTELDLTIQSTAPYSISLQTRHATTDAAPWPLCLNPIGGNVGIGTTAPRFPLHVAADGGLVPSISVAAGALSVTNSALIYGLQIGVRVTGGIWLQGGRTDGTATAYEIDLNPLGGAVKVAGSAIPVIGTQTNMLVSRALNSAYLNSNGKPMFVSVGVTISSGSSAVAYSDNSTVTTLVGSYVAAGGSQTTVVQLWVLPGFYYKIAASGTVAVNSWTEYV